MNLFAVIPPPPFQNVEFGPLMLHGYGLTAALGIVAGILMVEWALKRQGVNPDRLPPFILLVLLATIVGARLYDIASAPIHYAHHPSDIPRLWDGGLGVYGGILGAVLLSWACARRFGMTGSQLADAAAVAVPLTHGIARWGNYLNQELYGRPSDGWWALEVTRPHRPSNLGEQLTFQPLFLFESLSCLVISGILCVLLRRWVKRPGGILFPIYITAYGLVRSIIEPLRIEHTNTFLGVRQNEWLSLALIIVGATITIAMLRRGRTAHEIEPITP
jgi:prolipoprotein diacylglyceryl transferase